MVLHPQSNDSSTPSNTAGGNVGTSGAPQNQGKTSLTWKDSNFIGMSILQPTILSFWLCQNYLYRFVGLRRFPLPSSCLTLTVWECLCSPLQYVLCVLQCCLYVVVYTCACTGSISIPPSKLPVMVFFLLLKHSVKITCKVFSACSNAPVVTCTSTT